MNDTSRATASLSRAFVPLRLAKRPLTLKAAAIVVGVLVLALSARISVPMVPVPITMQTYAVLLIAALTGWRLGSLIMLAYLAAGALGLPVFSGGKSGLSAFSGASGGYFVGFVLATILVGLLAERGWTARGIVSSLVVMLAGHAVILAFGVGWLGFLLGAQKAISAGLVPFLPGTLIKSALVVASIEAAQRFRSPN